MNGAPAVHSEQLWIRSGTCQHVTTAVRYTCRRPGSPAVLLVASPVLLDDGGGILLLLVSAPGQLPTPEGLRGQGCCPQAAVASLLLPHAHDRPDLRRCMLQLLVPATLQERPVGALDGGGSSCHLCLAPVGSMQHTSLHQSMHQPKHGGCNLPVYKGQQGLSCSCHGKPGHNSQFRERPRRLTWPAAAAQRGASTVSGSPVLPAPGAAAASTRSASRRAAAMHQSTINHCRAF